MVDNTRRKYDPDFKRDALALLETSGRPVAEIAENLGVKPDLLYRWRRENDRKDMAAFPGHGKEALTSTEQRIRDLEKKLKDAEMERDILKKAVAIFSRTPK